MFGLGEGFLRRKHDITAPTKLMGWLVLLQGYIQLLLQTTTKLTKVTEYTLHKAVINVRRCQKKIKHATFSISWDPFHVTFSSVYKNISTRCLGNNSESSERKSFNPAISQKHNYWQFAMLPTIVEVASSYIRLELQLVSTSNHFWFSSFNSISFGISSDTSPSRILL